MGRSRLARTIYFPAAMLREITREARRLDRNVVWVVRRAWRLAIAEIRAMPSATFSTRDECKRYCDVCASYVTEASCRRGEHAH